MIPAHLVPTAAPLDAQRKRELQAFLADLPKHGSDALKEGLSVLWLHFVFVGGHTAAEATVRDSRAHNDTLAKWSHAAANLTGIPAVGLRRNWAPPVARMAIDLLDRARAAAAAIAGGEAQALLGGEE